MGINKPKPRGRPPRQIPGERLHIVIGQDIMEKVRADAKVYGGSHSAYIENILVQYYRHKNQQNKQEIV